MEREKADTSWLEDLFPNAAHQRAALEEKGLIVAQQYLVFQGPTSDPRARELLELWTRKIRRTCIPKNASVQELAAHNALREWVEGIWAQIEFAQQGANAPKPRTT